MAVCGSVRCCAGAPAAMSIVANMPGSSRWSGLARLARICTLRESVSTAGLTATILPLNVVPGNVSTVAVTVWPTET